MDAVEYLPLNAELRSYPLYFREHPGCTGVAWNVSTADQIKTGDKIGQFNFKHGKPLAIIAPVDAIVIGTYTPEMMYLPHPPSALLALFQPTETSSLATPP